MILAYVIFSLLIAVLLFFALMEYQDFFESKGAKCVWFVLSVMALVVISALRDPTVGVDTLKYADQYIKLNQMAFWDFNYTIPFEIGYVFLIKVLGLFSESPQMLLIVTSCFIHTAVGIFLYRHTESPFLGLLLYMLSGLYFSYMNIMRQAIATAIILLAYGLLKKHTFKSDIGFIVVVLLATLFHTAALVALALPLLWRIRAVKAAPLLWVVFGLLSFVLFELILQLLLIFFKQYAYYLNGIYAQSNYFAAAVNTLIAAVVLFTVYGAHYREIKDHRFSFRAHKLTAFFLKSEARPPDGYSYDRAGKAWLKEGLPIADVPLENYRLNFHMAVSGMYLVTSALVMRMILFVRIQALFTVFPLLTLPYAVKQMRGKKRTFFMACLILGYLAYFYVIAVFRPEWNRCIPYKFFWQ